MNPELAALLPDALRDCSSRVALADGQVLFRRGEPVEFIYYVVQGELLALRYLPSGSEVVMRAGAGEFFAQSAMGLSHYDCDAKAKSTTLAFREESMADKGLRLANLSEELGLDVATLSRAIS